jgi:hypothetical protein
MRSISKKMTPQNSGVYVVNPITTGKNNFSSKFGVILVPICERCPLLSSANTARLVIATAVGLKHCTYVLLDQMR